MPREAKAESSKSAESAAPPGGPRWAAKARGGRFGNLFFAALARRGGLAIAPFFLFWVALYFLLAAPAARRASFDLADRLGRGGSLARRLLFAFRHFFAFGSLLVDRLAIFAGKGDRFSIEVHGEEHIRKALKLGRGAVLLTAHQGNWEAMGQMARFETPIAIVMHDAVQPEMRATVEDLSRGRAARVLFTDGSPASAAAILDALARNEVVGMMGDRLLGGRGVAVPFLGGEALFPAGPFALAAAAGAPLIHSFAVRDGRRRYSFHGFPAGVPRWSDAGREADLARWAAEFAGRLESFVRAHPEQWGNFFSLWEAPPRESKR